MFSEARTAHLPSGCCISCCSAELYQRFHESRRNGVLGGTILSTGHLRALVQATPIRWGHNSTECGCNSSRPRWLSQAFRTAPPPPFPMPIPLPAQLVTGVTHPHPSKRKGSLAIGALNNSCAHRALVKSSFSPHELCGFGRCSDLPGPPFLICKWGFQSQPGPINMRIKCLVLET